MNSKTIIKPQTLKGFRDFLPKDMRIRNYVINVCKKVFESFGFEPLETPTLEYAQTLLGKYGAEADKLVYTFQDKGLRDVGLRYDLTVPVARVLAQYNQSIPMPFKRYQIQNVFRAEKPQQGRYREFTQCDIDIFGVKSPLADAEIIVITYKILTALGFKQFCIQINSRQVLFEILKNANVAPSLQLSVLQSIDKLQKQGQEKVVLELIKKGLNKQQIDNILEKINQISPDKNLEEMIGYLKDYGVAADYYKYVPSMVRGLDYYTGPIFETVLSGPSLGSLTGGGRYDNLISLLGGPNITGTGTTIGIDRICEIIKEKNLLPNLVKPTAKVLLINNPNDGGEIIKIAEKLRANNINCELYLTEADWSKQLKYANKKGIPYVIIMGPDEVKTNQVALKNMKTGEQSLVDIEKLINILRN